MNRLLACFAFTRLYISISIQTLQYIQHLSQSNSKDFLKEVTLFFKISIPFFFQLPSHLFSFILQLLPMIVSAHCLFPFPSNLLSQILLCYGPIMPHSEVTKVTKQLNLMGMFSAPPRCTQCLDDQQYISLWITPSFLKYTLLCFYEPPFFSHPSKLLFLPSLSSLLIHSPFIGN